jgi:hypothetical protein
MSKSDEYRANAQECQRMAGICRDPNEKTAWLQKADDWLRMIMIQKADAAERPEGAGKATQADGRKFCRLA